jgi:hypothetical protein
MNKLTRNLILPAAALAALLLAPTSEAQGFRDRGHPSRGNDRGDFDRGRDRRGTGWRGHAYNVAPRYVAPRYVPPYRAPWRATSGFRFYSTYPGPGYAWIAGYGWTLPPFFGAVWVPPHFDIGGFRVEGFWR